MQNNTFFGQSTPASLIVLDKVSSSNDFAKQLLTKFKPQQQYTAIMAKKQTQGRGQRGTKWSSPENENLYISYIYNPKDLPVEKQFLLTIKASLACFDVIQTFIPNDIAIKWPNDIMVQNRKIAGILIENKINLKNITQTIIGIGINVLTTDFPHSLKSKATSIRMESKNSKVSLFDLAKMIRNRLQHYNNLINNNKEHMLWDKYSSNLFRKDTSSRFIINESNKEGVIKGVNHDGLLMIEIEGIVSNHDLKSVTYLL